MEPRVLLDVGPASGGHGLRGTGRYVRGVIDSLNGLPAESRGRVWAVGIDADTLRLFGERAITSRFLGVRPFDLGLIVGPAVLGRAVRRANAGVFHATDPHRPWITRSVVQAVTAYDLIPLREEGMLASWRPHHRHVYRVYLDQLRAAAMVVAISRTTADDVIELLDVPAERVTIVSPVVTPPAGVRRAPAATPTFLWVGALDPHKQPELAVEALGEFRRLTGDGRLRFIGPSGDHQRRSVLDKAQALGLGDFVSLGGRISDAELDSAYESATALLSTSRIEGFGLPGVEAILRGVPVIAVDIPSARETLGDAAALVPADARLIAEAMAAPRELTRGTRDRIGARYSRRSAAEALWAVYSTLLD
jgi:glycosyltransferase involved in cell wall biosynthesis